MTIDLAHIFDNENERDRDQTKVDLSGRPIPKNVRAQLNSGFELQCEVAYDGESKNTKNMRRYLIKAEIDWYKHWISTLVVGEWPEDVELILDLPESEKGAVPQYFHQMTTYIEKRIPIVDD
jgi:hypothetical protein